MDQVPSQPPGHGRTGGPDTPVCHRVVQRVFRPVCPLRTGEGSGAASADASAVHRPGRHVPPETVRLRHAGHPRPEHVRQDMDAGQGTAVPDFVVRARRPRVQGARLAADQVRRAALRRARGLHLPVRQRSMGPRHVLTRAVRRQGLHDDRLGRRADQPDPWGDHRCGVRLLLRDVRLRRAAGHRGSDVGAVAAAVADPVRLGAERVDPHPGLFRAGGHPVAARVDQPGEDGAWHGARAS